MKTLTFATGALIAATTAFGQLAPADYAVAGDHLLTRDFSTRLEWLDISLTYSRSYHQVESALAPGGEFAGFRFATQEEFTQLHTSQGIPVATWDAPIGLDSTIFTRVFALQHLLGFATPSDPNRDYLTAGFLLTIDPLYVSTDVAFGSLEVLDYISEQFVDLYRAHTYFVEPFTAPYTGSFLVRDFAPVPEPSTYAFGALFCLTAAGLSRWRRTRAMDEA